MGRSNCVAIFINQIREKIGVSFGNPETTTGGRALKYFATVRIDVRKLSLIHIFAEESSLESELRKAVYIIARMPTMMVNAYQAKIGHYDNKSTYFHPVRPGESMAQSILSTLRIDREYTEEEAKLLDTCLMLNAAHEIGRETCRARV